MTWSFDPPFEGQYFFQKCCPESPGPLGWMSRTGDRLVPTRYVECRADSMNIFSPYILAMYCCWYLLKHDPTPSPSISLSHLFVNLSCARSHSLARTLAYYLSPSPPTHADALRQRTRHRDLDLDPGATFAKLASATGARVDGAWLVVLRLQWEQSQVFGTMDMASRTRTHALVARALTLALAVLALTHGREAHPPRRPDAAYAAVMLPSPPQVTCIHADIRI